MKMKPSRASILLDKPTSCLPRRVPLPPYPAENFVPIFYNSACVAPKPRKPWWYLDIFGQKNFPAAPIFSKS